MPFVQMPNGDYVNIADGTPPDVIERIKAQYASKKPTQVFAQDDTAEKSLRAHDAEVDNRVLSRFVNPFKVGGRTGYDNAISSATFGLSDKLDAAGNAAMSSLLGGKSFGDEYALNKEVIEREKQNFENYDPLNSGASNIAGMFLTPIGESTGLLKGLAKVAPAARDTLLASKIGRLLAKAGTSSVGVGARTGFNNGVAAGFADSIDDPSNIPGTAVNSGLLGGVAGGALGALTGAAGKGLSIYNDRHPDNALRVAYGKIASALDRSHNPDLPGSQPYTPRTALNEIRATDAAGGDAMLMDLSPEMRNMAGYLASRPGLRAANALEERVANRTAAASDRFDKGVNTAMGHNGGPAMDGYETIKATTAARKARGAEDYAEGGVLDNTITLTPEIEKAFRDSPDADKWLNEGFTYAQRFGHENLGKVDPVGGKIHPSGRVYDYMMQAANDDIGSAMQQGKTKLAASLSTQLQRFKELIGEANPDLKDVWKFQRDAFQQANSVETGMNFLKRMRSDSRALLDDMRSEKIDKDMLRTGIADALLHMRQSTDNPVALMRRFMRHDDQRKVLQYAFGNNKILNEFDRFMRRELRSERVDRIVNPTTGSKTNVLNQQGEPDEGQAIALAGRDALQGFAFGGPAGMGSRVLRWADRMNSGLGPAAQEELARILSGKGEGLASGVKSAENYLKRRKEAAARRAILAGKLGAGSTAGIAQE